MIGPCMCGATDCPRCYPSTWRQEEAEERLAARKAAAAGRLGPETTRPLPGAAHWLTVALRWARGLADADPQDLADGLSDEDKEALDELALRLGEVVEGLGEVLPTTIDDLAPGEREDE